MVSSVSQPPCKVRRNHDRKGVILAKNDTCRGEAIALTNLWEQQPVPFGRTDDENLHRRTDIIVAVAAAAGVELVRNAPATRPPFCIRHAHNSSHFSIDPTTKPNESWYIPDHDPAAGLAVALQLPALSRYHAHHLLPVVVVAPPLLP